MKHQEVLSQLFNNDYEVTQIDDCLTGLGRLENLEIALVGTTNAKPIGIEAAAYLAGELLRIVKEEPRRPILLLIDTSGQRLSHKDELLGINTYLAHLAKCIDLARREGHRIISLVYAQAVSGGYLASGSLADDCFAIADSEVKVMNLDAMSRVTKIPMATLEQLSEESPVFAPGVENYYKMGALRDIWYSDLQGKLLSVLSDNKVGTDQRRKLGELRGGRMLANHVSIQVREACA